MTNPRNNQARMGRPPIRVIFNLGQNDFQRQNHSRLGTDLQFFGVFPTILLGWRANARF
jgi:hypothetical protein